MSDPYRKLAAEIITAAVEDLKEALKRGDTVEAELNSHFLITSDIVSHYFACDNLTGEEIVDLIKEKEEERKRELRANKTKQHRKRGRSAGSTVCRRV